MHINGLIISQRLSLMLFHQGKKFGLTTGLSFTDLQHSRQVIRDYRIADVIETL